MKIVRVPDDSQWRQIPIFTNYWINQYGHVFNMKRNILMSLHYNQHHVLCVRMYGVADYRGPRGYMRSVPKLVQDVWGKPISGSDLESSREANRET